jgi:hypothetical protein
MGKISAELKAQFAEKSTPLKERAEEINNEIKKLEIDIAKNDPLAFYKRLTVANLYMNIILLYIKISDLSLEILGIKNEGYLEKARKLCYKFLSVLEEIVGTYIDAPLTENKEALEKIKKLDDVKRYKLIKKIAEVIQIVEERFGPNSKWKWSFVDLDARAATVCKNLVDYKKIQGEMDPRIEGFADRMETIRFIKTYLRRVADRLREKYELSTQDPSEMKNAIKFLSVLMRIENIFKEGDEANNLKKNIKIWEEKLEQDMEAADKKKQAKQKKKK